jgi:multidrug efflux system membrane fusion protein
MTMRTQRAETVERRPPAEPIAIQRRRRHPWTWIVVLVVLAALGYWLASRWWSPAGGTAGPVKTPPVPVVAATTHQGDLPLYLTGLGSVTAFNTVTVKSRVDGQLVRIAFQEGQHVHEGDVLAEVDPRPFEVQLTQAQGQLARDTAQLKDARVTLERYRDLFAQKVVSKQELDDQVAKAEQYEGATEADRGLIDNAKLQLTYSRVTAPISGRVGLRLVDVGNVVHANDQNGLVVITQLQPITVIFTLPEDNLPPIIRKLAAGEQLTAEAFDRAGRNRIATGTLSTVDNQIDQSTGTTRLKAIFSNDDDALFPNQFVNVRLLLETRKGVVLVPVPAIQRGPQGTYVYVVKPDNTVEVRPVTIDATSGDEASVASGLSANETVVIDGVDKLRAGAAVQVRAAQPDHNHSAPGPPA